MFEALLGLAGARHLFERDRVVAEVEAGQLVHAVAVQPALEDVGQQHGVVDRGHADAAPGHDGEVVFAVLGDLEDGGVFQQGLEPGQRRGLVDLDQGLAGVGLAAEIEAAGVGGRLMLMGQGDVAGVIGADGEGDAAQARVGGAEGIGLGVEADDAGRRGAGDEGVEVFEGLDTAVGVGVDGLDRGGALDDLAVAGGGDGG